MASPASSKKQIIESIKDKKNILVAVSSSPSVDELSAALGLTIFLNKLDKHVTAIASGTIPSALGFLDPEKTFEATADSLRDFIIALDKEKADHLRYKLDGDVVKSSSRRIVRLSLRRIWSSRRATTMLSWYWPSMLQKVATSTRHYRLMARFYTMRQLLQFQPAIQRVALVRSSGMKTRLVV